MQGMEELDDKIEKLEEKRESLIKKGKENKSEEKVKSFLRKVKEKKVRSFLKK